MTLMIETNLYILLLYVTLFVYVCVYLYTSVSPCICHVMWELPAGFLISEKRKPFHAFNPRDSKDKGRKKGMTDRGCEGDYRERQYDWLTEWLNTFLNERKKENWRESRG